MNSLLASPKTRISFSALPFRGSSFILTRVLSSLALVLLLLLPGCGKETRVTRVDTDVVTDFSGRWNDTDSRQVAETMVKEMISQPWLGNFTRDKGNPPVVIVGTVSESEP